MSESSPSPKPEEQPSVEPTEAEVEDIGIPAPETTEKTYPAPPVDEASRRQYQGKRYGT